MRYAFGRAREALVANTPVEVLGVLDAVHAHAVAGRWCVGYLRYEAAPAFESNMACPCRWAARMVLRARRGKTLARGLRWRGFERRAAGAAMERAPETTGVRRGDLLDPRCDHARRGLPGQLHGPIHAQRRACDAGTQCQESLQLFAALRRSQPAAYAAWIDTGAEQVVSVSPELFFNWQDGQILARPMKGTAARGATAQADAQAADALRSSKKERAENVMIVDLLRNDLSRIAQPHSVRAERLFDVSAWPTVWQMTSDVTACTRSGTTLSQVFGALFPCGSVKGAPKLSAMRLIHQLEHGARGVYCGAVGLVMPGGNAIFNVPIRTVLMDNDGAHCGIGSGVTIDAHAQGEWAEWRNKRAFLMRASAPFQILETLHQGAGELRHASEHLARMAAAATHFGYAFDLDWARGRLQGVAAEHGQGNWRVRLLLDATGQLQAQAFELPPSPTQVRLQLASRPFEDAHGEFVRFKTTRRAHYEAFAPADPEVFDTLLWNEHGELTECTRGNVAFLIDGQWVTPAARCGLLAGIERGRGLRDGRLVECVVRAEDLGRVQATAFINNLRGWLDATVVD